MEKNTHLKKEIGLLIATALVTGNMMGSGIFMLPATLASVSGPGGTILAWILTGIGSIFLALSFANLGSKITKTGGPYEFGKIAFGDFVGFMNAWLYWNGSWIGNAAIIIAIASYTGSLLPVINSNHFVGFLYTSAILWVFTIINIMGVKRAGIIQTCITIFELLLFLCFIGITAVHFNPAFLKPMFPAGKGINTTSTAAAATLWAFIGFETAAVTAGEIKNPERNVKLSTILGISIAVIMYMAISVFAMGAMPQAKLAQSGSPIADILAITLGKGVSNVILVAAIISVLGTTVGWLLATARMSYAAGMDGTFPAIFAKVHPKYKTPVASLIISAILANILLFMNNTQSMLQAFKFVMLLATLAYLPMYACAAAADIKLFIRDNKNAGVGKLLKGITIPTLGVIYAAWTIYSNDLKTILYCVLLIIIGIPFYLYVKKGKKAQSEKEMAA